MTNELILDNLDIAHKITNDYIRKGNIIEYEDLKQICYLGLVKAARTFNPSYKYFSTYAYKVIQNEINQELRKYKKRDKNISLETPFEENLVLGDMLESSVNIENEVIDKDFKYILLNAINDLEGLEQKVMLLRVEGKKQHEIAKILNISQPHTSRIIKKVIKKIKGSFEI